MSSSSRLPHQLWTSAVLISTQSFLFGYCLASFNPCLVTGDQKNGSFCYDGSDDTCPPGTVFNDINLSTGKGILPISPPP